MSIAGAVICRQRPGTAKGFVFVSLEDETGVANAIVTPDLFEKRRLVITQESFLRITGKLQNDGGVIHVKAARIEPFQMDWGNVGASMEALGAWMLSLGKPLLVGIPALGLTLAVLGYFAVVLAWRASVVLAWRARKRRRQGKPAP